MRSARVHSRYIVVQNKDNYIYNFYTVSTKLNYKNSKQTCICKHERKLIANSSKKNEKDNTIPYNKVRNTKTIKHNIQFIIK